MTPTELAELTRFQGTEGKLTKISSKRSNSQVSVAQFVEGEISIIRWAATDKHPERWAALVVGRGMSDVIRTSPIVKIVDFTETTTTFETEGGVYKLEKL